MAGPIPIGLRVLIPAFQYNRATALLRAASRSYGRLYQGRFQPPWTRSSPALNYSGSRSFTRSRQNWNRKRLPVYGSFASSIPMRQIYVPGTITFPWLNPEDLWDDLPLVRWATPRNSSIYATNNIPIPNQEVWFNLTPGGPRGGPPEMHRRRHDSKVPGWYNRSLAIINRTYGRLSEYGDLASVLYHNNSVPAVMTGLALENAIDYAYGAQNRFLKENVYGRYWNLPFGIQAASRLWR